MTRKYTLKEIQEKINEIFGEGLIALAEGQEYQGIRKPLVFIDRDYGNWTTPPFNIIQQKNTHPERSKERRKQTNLKRYGHENAFGSKEIQDKIRETNLDKYGVANPMQADAVKQKLRASCTEKYGCPVPLTGNAEAIILANSFLYLVANLLRLRRVLNPTHLQISLPYFLFDLFILEGGSTPITFQISLSLLFL